MKTKFKNLMLLASLILPIVSHAQTTPFQEGTSSQWTSLSPAQRQELQAYLHAVKTELEDAVKLAAGKELKDANEIYKAVVINVVSQSYENDPRSGLLLRYALNRGMEVTFGIPKVTTGADGQPIVTFPTPGILSATSNADLLTVILENSITLAIKYYQDDREASKNGNLLDLPYSKFAVDELQNALDWEESVNEYQLKYKLLRYAVGAYINQMSNNDQNHQQILADNIVKAHNLLTVEYPESMPTELVLLQGKVSTFRQAVKNLAIESKKAAQTMSEKMHVPKNLKFNDSVKLFADDVNDVNKIGNRIDLQFVYIPADSFTMGTGKPYGEGVENEMGRHNDTIPHKVAFSKGFYMQTTEVTQAQYAEVFKLATRAMPSHFNGENLPMESLNFAEANHFIEILNKRFGLECGDFNQARKTPGCFRLPTEAEWEYAARAGSTTRFTGGIKESELKKYMWFKKNSDTKTHAVNECPNDEIDCKNKLGLYHMFGNVSEWVADSYHPLKGSSLRIDPFNEFISIYNAYLPLPPLYAVMRGCHYNCSSSELESANRDYKNVNDKSSTLGLRLVRTAE